MSEAEQLLAVAVHALEFCACAVVAGITGPWSETELRSAFSFGLSLGFAAWLLSGALA